MVREANNLLLLAGLLVAGLLTSCSPNRAFKEWVVRQPEAVRFGCPSFATPSNSASLPFPIALNVVRPGPGLSAFAGDLNQHPNSIHVPFSNETPPLLILKADLRRILEAHNGATQAGATPSPLRLDATLHIAYTDRTFHVVKSSAMRGRVLFDFTIFDPQTGATNWVQRILREYRVRPNYITSQSVEEALAGAYCAALAAFNDALSSRELQANLQP